MTRTIFYTALGLDRAHTLREDEEWLAQRLGGAGIRVFPLWRDRVLVSAADNPDAILMADAEATALHSQSGETVFLGVDGDVAYFATDLSHLEEPANHVPLPENTSFEDLRRLAGDLEHGTATMLAYARALAYWHRTHQFCGMCGAPTESRKAGHERKCTNPDCGKTHFPRTDPAVIMLVTLGNGKNQRALLAQNKRFPSGIRYSTLAGFVEPAETLEQAVAREVFEETGIRVSDVQYQASQPWPFPANLMLGFRASAENEDIVIQEDEIADARWFSRDEVLDMAAQDGVLPPSQISISRWLIDTWLDETA